jgi:hypothetical protein
MGLQINLPVLSSSCCYSNNDRGGKTFQPILVDACPVALLYLSAPSMYTIVVVVVVIVVVIIIIIIIIIITTTTISFMKGIYTYIPETNYVPKEYNVAAILSLLFMVPISLVPVLTL